MDHYIGWLKERVEEVHRTLKPTGSFYLHCDWHADAYIRVQILDKVFGMNNFRNEIVWSYDWGGRPKDLFAQKHDTIWFYTKGKKWTFNTDDIRIPYQTEIKGRKNPLVSQEKFDKGKIPTANWIMPVIHAMSPERIGYPTQKPEALLERIIKASSNEGDVVLDCFVGGGTTIAVAERLKRKWIGVDQSVAAIKVTEARLNKQRQLWSEPFSVKLHKYDYDTVRYTDAFEFENWIVEQFGGEPNAKQRGDMGLDGKKNGVPIQVKRSDGIGRNVVDNFKSAMGRFFGKDIEKRKGDKIVDGYIIAFSFGKGAVEEVARLKNEEGLIIELIKVEDIVPLASKPKVELFFEDLGVEKEKRKIKFIAKADSKIEIYQWDFAFDGKEFKPSEMFEKSNEIETLFEKGSHVIICKAVDENGIDGIAELKIQVNGVIKQV